VREGLLLGEKDVSHHKNKKIFNITPMTRRLRPTPSNYGGYSQIQLIYADFNQ